MTQELGKSDVEAVLSGDRAALVGFVDVLTPIIQARVARALMRSRMQASWQRIRQEVEDLTQEVFAALFENNARAIRAWDPDKGMSLTSFVALYASRQAVSILRTKKRSPWTEDPTLSDDLEKNADNAHLEKGTDGATNPEARVSSKELLSKLFERLTQELSPLGLELFRLVCVQELPLSEVCEKTNMSPDAVYAWRSRLIRRSRQILSQLMSENAA